MSAPRIVVTSPWKLGLFVFLLVTGCGFGLIYAYYGYFGGRLDFGNSQAVQDFYLVCGSVAFLGLLGYLAIVSAAQPADQVAHFGQRRRKLLKKAAGIDDPTRIDLESFQHEPALASVLERWREDRQRLEEIESTSLESDHRERIGTVCQEFEAVQDETNSLAINAALQLSRLGDEAAPLLQTMEQLQEISNRYGRLVTQLRELAGVADSEGVTEDRDGEFVGETETAASLNTESATALDLETPIAPSPQMSPLAGQTSVEPLAPEPVAMGVSPEDELSAIHDELFHRTAPAPVAPPVETGEEEQVYDLDAFGAVELPPTAPTGEPSERIYDLREFGAVEL